MNMLRENMRLIAECSQQLVSLGEILWGKKTTEDDVDFDVVVKETTKDISDKVVDTLMGGLMVGKSFNLPQGYIFKDENGNVINATKIVLEKKKYSHT